jgi:succinyl-CoA synthetase beta subunit
MNLHEYQSKKIFAEYGIPVPQGIVADSPAAAEAAAKQLGGSIWVVKAQVHAGGRGKAGGITLARDAAAVRDAAQKMLGSRLVTKQTGPEGLPVNQVYIEVGSEIEREIYLSLTLNREKSRIAVVASAAGGVNIEEVAEKEPHKILTAAIHPAVGLEAYQARELAFGLGFNEKQIAQFTTLLKALYRLYIERDASLVEVNPLIVTRSGDLVALDAKIGIDANALFRQPAMAALRDATQEDPIEARAAAWSTARALPWPRWISSSCTAAVRPTFWMLAAAPRSSA